MSYRTTLALAVASAAALIAGPPAAMAQDAAAPLIRYERLPAGAYAVVATIRAKRGKEDEMRKATIPLIAAVRAEPGNLLYFLHEDRETPGQFVFYEIFTTAAAFELHRNTPHVQAWFAKLPELAEGGDVKLTRLEILGSKPAGRRP